MKHGLIQQTIRPANASPVSVESDAKNPAVAQEPQQTDTARQAPQYKSRIIEAIPEHLRVAFERIVLSGMKVLYSPQTQDDIKAYLQSKLPMERKLAEGVAKLVRLLDTQAKKGLPQELIIPAAIELLYEAASFVQEIGAQEVSQETLDRATQYLVVLLGKMYGASDEQIQQVFSGNAAQTQPATEPLPQQPTQLNGVSDGL